MATRWHNWCFLSSSPSPSPKNTNLAITHWQEWKSASPVEKIQNTCRAKQSEFGHTEEGKNSFTLSVSLLPKSGTVQWQERPSPCEISPMGESDSLWVSIQLSHCVGCWQRSPLLSHLIQNTKLSCITEGTKKTAAQGSKCIRDVNPTYYFML